MTLKTNSEKETKESAKKIIVNEISKNRREALVFALSGELGAGKTTFVKGASEHLNPQIEATSPTFLIIQKYPSAFKKIDSVFHIDAYRINDEVEMTSLDFNKIIKNKKNIVFIEWPENIKPIIPGNALWIYFSHGKKGNERIIKINND